MKRVRLMREKEKGERKKRKVLEVRDDEEDEIEEENTARLTTLCDTDIQYNRLERERERGERVN